MKPANLAWCALLVVAGPAACVTGEVAPPTVTITGVRMVALPSEPSAVAFGPVVARPGREDLASVRDERRLDRGKSIALLVTEIQGLESLFASMAKASPDRPRLAHRLTEGYVELGLAAKHEGSARGEKITKAARMAAIKYYQLIANQYPTWCAVPDAVDPTRSTGCADEAFYYRALESERAGDLDEARKAYLMLIQGYPASRFIPAAYLAFGELFMAEAANDPPKLSLAEQSYQEVAKYPPPENWVYGYALFRLAEVYSRQGDDPRALSTVMKAVEAAAASGDDRLGAAARREAVTVYARAGDPAKARAFFSRFMSGSELEETLGELFRGRPLSVPGP